MKKTIAIGITLVLLLGLFIVGCNGGGVAGGPAIEMISAEVQTGGQQTETETTTTGTGSPLIPTTTTTTGITGTTAPTQTTATTTTAPTQTTVTTTTTPAQTTATGLTTTTTMAGEGGLNVVVNVRVANFDMVSEVGATDGDGYLAYYVDELPAEITGVPGIEVSPTPEDTMSQPANETTDTSYTFENVDSGIHIFSVQLVDASGNSLSPAVIAAVVLTVPPPGAEITTTTTTTATTTTETTATATP